jgi:hypothetical protein
MKRIAFTFCAVALLLSYQSSAQKDKATGKKASQVSVTKEVAPDSATAMKNWNEYMTPSAVHKQMASWDGEWTGEITMWMDPSAPPTKSTGTSINKMIMEGRYQLSHTKGNFGGMALEGMNILAYDNHKQKFITTWVDNFGTGVMTLEGPWDEATKTMTLTGKMVDPTTKKEVPVKETFRVIDNDHQEMEMFATGPDGKEFKTMHIAYTRKK